MNKLQITFFLILITASSTLGHKLKSLKTELKWPEITKANSQGWKIDENRLITMNGRYLRVNPKWNDRVLLNSGEERQMDNECENNNYCLWYLFIYINTEFLIIGTSKTIMKCAC